MSGHILVLITAKKMLGKQIPPLDTKQIWANPVPNPFPLLYQAGVYHFSSQKILISENNKSLDMDNEFYSIGTARIKPFYFAHLTWITKAIIV